MSGHPKRGSVEPSETPLNRSENTKLPFIKNSSSSLIPLKKENRSRSQNNIHAKKLSPRSPSPSRDSRHSNRSSTISDNSFESDETFDSNSTRGTDKSQPRTNSQKRNFRRRMKKTNSDFGKARSTSLSPREKPTPHDIEEKKELNSLTRSESFVRTINRTKMKVLFDEKRPNTEILEFPAHFEFLVNKQVLFHLFSGFQDGNFKVRIEKKEPSHGYTNIKLSEVTSIRPKKYKGTVEFTTSKSKTQQTLYVLNQWTHHNIGSALKSTMSAEFKSTKEAPSQLLLKFEQQVGSPIFNIDIKKEDEEKKSRGSFTRGVELIGSRLSGKVEITRSSQSEFEWVVKAPLDPKGHLIPKKKKEELLKKIPEWKIIHQSGALISKIGRIWGPNVSEEEEKVLNVVSAKSASTYPVIHGSRQADPICDSWALELYPNQIFVSIADGCGWGTPPRNSSFFSSQYFVNSMVRNLPAIQKVQDAAVYMLEAFESCHAGIVKGKNLDDVFLSGTTTLLGAMAIEITSKKKKENPAQKNWGFLGLNVGDCKCFKYDVRTKEIVDLNYGNRSEVNDPKDPGGRIGPHLEGGLPDWRNIAFCFTKCSSEDIFILCTDGIHDNFDPELLNISLQEAKHPQASQVKTWPEAEQLFPKETLECRSKNMCDLIREKIGGSTVPSKITNVLLNHAIQTTQSSRDFLEKHDERLPDDYAKFPGKLDHASLVVFQIP